MTTTIVKTRNHWRITAILIALFVVVLFVVANAHLIFVAIQSQPDCVPHAKSGSDGAHRAARSSC
ncbi:hypothetical protein ACI0FM_15470 [Paenochrobactrum sp. BZR 588]|uniref:hypothetical protein n=1 Tax=Paenochrobactrum sp. BZR 588 TaxID=3378076 RepID=UPI0038548668